MRESELRAAYGVSEDYAVDVEERIEMVTWLDAETRDGWREHDEAIADMTVGPLDAWVIGVVIAETDDRLILAAMGNDRSYASTHGIPKVAIIKRVVLKRGG